MNRGPSILRLFVLFIAVLALLAPAGPALAQSAPTCQFVLGFVTLHALDSADFGNCVDNQIFVGNGDALQRLRRRNYMWLLVPDNPAFKTIEVETSQLRVLGVVVRVLKGKP